jgi:ubiquitin-conjugating enzyme E2 J1
MATLYAYVLGFSSHDWTCHKCGQRNIEQLPDPGSSSSVKHASEFDGTRAVTLPSAPTHTEHRQEIIPNVASTGRDDDAPSHPPAPTPVTPTPTMTIARNIATASRKSTRPPVILDTAICILLVLASALICRRVL